MLLTKLHISPSRIPRLVIMFMLRNAHFIYLYSNDDLGLPSPLF